MARTIGHTMHRYQGEKIYRSEYLARKYALVEDNGAEPIDPQIAIDAEAASDAEEAWYQAMIWECLEMERGGDRAMIERGFDPYAFDPFDD